ncbi:hypothetical protein BKA64DRAFT_93224 [Cadophora sp. MPI-SDFR-AT-0126]|nr:hypothetical protein BKA64DRAFT_93224 [Leotiomycetes sp. MPI-SDFR-AT-0126]
MSTRYFVSKRMIKSYSRLIPEDLHVVADSCRCFCGGQGCLPTHLLWRCPHSDSSYQSGGINHCFGVDMTRKIKILRKWLSCWSMSKKTQNFIYDEIVRLQLFDRLGMAPTCCAQNGYVCPENMESGLMPKDEKARLREGDSELSKQLQILLHEFRRGKSKFSGCFDDFWLAWWQVVDEILPPLLPLEACRRRPTGQLNHYTKIEF